MLKSFSINNFRLFRSLQVSSLGQVNLLVGKNNTGKSAFLEAVQVYISEAAPRLLWSLVTLREENWRGISEVVGDDEAGSPIRHLFRGHHLPELGEDGIVLESAQECGRLHLRTAAYRSHFDEEEDAQLETRVAPSEADPSDPEIRMFLVLESGKRTKRLMRLDRSGEPPRSTQMPLRQLWEDRERVQVVPTRSMSTSDIAALWDLIGLLPELEEEVISGLKLIDESIQDIAFVMDLRGSGQRIPLARSSSFDEPVPLNSMGDGVSRLLQIILALVSAKDGVLLVDEFENGLHWTLQPQVWSTVFRLAERLNVQVFATTHSRDCVEAFHSAWQDKPGLGTFYRLSLDKTGDVRPVAYDLETLGDAVATRVEVR